jgi:aryl-alcohol dehydrogenase-like predicted oxidoreductase
MNPTQPTAQQQKVLERIRAQRERLRARRAERNAADAQDADRVPPNAPLAARALAFVRLHPVATAVTVGMAVVAGPARLVRWAGVLIPVVVRLRRGR